MPNSEEMEKMRIIDLEKRKQALADYLQIDPQEINVCPTRINDIATFQTKRVLYLVGTEAEIEAGIRGYFEHNLSDLDSAFIGRTARLSADDGRVVDRLCEILDEDIETDVLNEALLGIIKKCGSIDSLIDAAVAGADRGEFLAQDGKEIAFGDYLMYRFRDGQCSDIDH